MCIRDRLKKMVGYVPSEVDYYMDMRAMEVIRYAAATVSYTHLVTETQPKTTVEDVKKQTVKLSEYTTYSTNTENGTHNMALSLAAANGTVLKPGEIFSFNETTGDTTTGALGYLPALSLIHIFFSKAQNSIGKPAAEGKQQQHQNHERLGEKAEHRKGPHNPA